MSLVRTEMETIAAEQDKVLHPLTPETPLLDTGLDSLCFAILVARLEDRLGIDPFTASEEVSFPVKVGDFVALYETEAAAPA